MKNKDRMDMIRTGKEPPPETSREKYKKELARFENMTLDDFKVELGNKIYEAALLFEKMEGFGKIIGNGHHAAQQVSEFAVQMAQERWRKPKEEKEGEEGEEGKEE